MGSPQDHVDAIRRRRDDGVDRDLRTSVTALAPAIERGHDLLEAGGSQAEEEAGRGSSQHPSGLDVGRDGRIVAVARNRGQAAFVGAETNGTSLMSSRPRVPPPILLAVGSGFRTVRPDAIDWIEADGNRVRLRLGEAEYPIRASLQATVQRLGARFRRIHRRYAVNVARIEAIEPNGEGTWVVTLAGGLQLPLGRSYRRHLISAFTQL